MTNIEAPEVAGKIFHVDDDGDFTAKLNEVLQSHGYSVVLTAVTVAQAILLIPERLIQAGVNLAIIDGHLPGGSGEGIASKIRASNLHVPIIALTAQENTTWGDQNVCKADGPRSLLQAIATALETKPG